jgi:hypothetical protein
MCQSTGDDFIPAAKLSAINWVNFATRSSTLPSVGIGPIFLNSIFIPVAE